MAKMLTQVGNKHAFFLPGDGFTSNYLPKQFHVEEHVSGKMSKVKTTSENVRGINEKKVKIARQR